MLFRSHPFGYLAPYGVFPVEVWGWSRTDEELAVCAMVVLSAGHADRAALKRSFAEFGKDVSTGTAPACAGGVASLGHEIRDDTAEFETVIKAQPYKFLDSLHLDRGEIRAHFNDHPAKVQAGEEGAFHIRPLAGEGWEHGEEGEQKYGVQNSYNDRHLSDYLRLFKTIWSILGRLGQQIQMNRQAFAQAILVQDGFPGLLAYIVELCLPLEGEDGCLRDFQIGRAHV